MSIATRTVAEATRAKALTYLTATQELRKTYTASSVNLTKLDLSCLPVETKFKLAMIEMSGHGPDYLNEDDEDLIMLAGIRSVEGTLRQASWIRHGEGAEKWIGLELRLPKSSRTSASKHYVNICPNGASGSLRAMYKKEIADNLSPDHKGFRDFMSSNPIYRLVMPQHLLRFPATYHGRDDVSFLGLPQGTIVPLKNGGKFEVNCRTNVTVEADGSASGHLHLVALDDKAVALADSMGWGKERVLSKGGYLVPPNLYTAKTGGRGFDIEGIRCPYIDPTIGMPDIFVGGIKHEVSPSYTTAVKGKGVWAATPEELATQLDDFLFG